MFFTDNPTMPKVALLLREKKSFSTDRKFTIQSRGIDLRIYYERAPIQYSLEGTRDIRCFGGLRDWIMSGLFVGESYDEREQAFTTTYQRGIPEEYLITFLEQKQQRQGFETRWWHTSPTHAEVMRTFLYELILEQPEEHHQSNLQPPGFS